MLDNDLIHNDTAELTLSFILVSYVEERPRWPIQCLNKGRKKKVKVKRRGDKIKFIDLRFDKGQIVGFRKARRQYVP